MTIDFLNIWKKNDVLIEVLQNPSLWIWFWTLHSVFKYFKINIYFTKKEDQIFLHGQCLVFRCLVLLWLTVQTRFKKNVSSFIRPASLRCRQEFWIHKYFDQFRVCSIGNLEKHLRRHFTLRSFKRVKISISNFQNKQSAVLLAKRIVPFFPAI